MRTPACWSSLKALQLFVIFTIGLVVNENRHAIARLMNSMNSDVAKLLPQFRDPHLKLREVAGVIYSNRKLLAIDSLQWRCGTDEDTQTGTPQYLPVVAMISGDASERDKLPVHGSTEVLRNRRILVSNNECTFRDISIVQIQQKSSGIPHYVVQIVNTCVSDCVPFDVCTDKDISITQSRDFSSSGIPLYSVQITNTCMSDCAPADIHVNCGWFASSPPPNPNVFTRLGYNDCLVNGGNSLTEGNIIQFQYANSFEYPLSFKSARFCR